jgi:hypothetical protein
VARGVAEMWSAARAGARAAKRGRRLLQVALLLAVLFSALPEGAFAQVVESCPTNIGRAPAVGEITPTPYWNTELIFDDAFRPVSMTSDGQSLFLLDHGDANASPPRVPRIIRLPLHERSYRTCVLPVPEDWTDAGADPRFSSVLLLGPRAFYLVSNADVAPHVPTLYRADRFPTAIRGGWRALRSLAGGANEGVDAVVENTTLFALRSDSGVGYQVDWQPIESTSAESITPPGTTITLAGTNGVRRPAAGVAVAEKAIYAFGGRFSEDSVVRIPLKNRVPSEIEDLPRLPNDRIGSRALIHARSLYLVGGNEPGKPVIERTAVPLAISNGRIQWDAMPDPPDPSDPIIASTIAKGRLWLVRESGHMQSTSAEAIQPGRTSIEWGTSIRRQRTVQKGDSFTLALPFKYSSPQEWADLSVDLTASPRQTDSRSTDKFATFDATSLPVGTILEKAPPRDPLDGPTLCINVTIPALKTRTEYVAIAMLRSGPPSGKTCLATLNVRPCLQKLGPQLVLRFVVDKRPLLPGQTPTPTPTPRPFTCGV